MKTPNTWDFHHKNSQLEHFLSRIHQKLGIFDEIFPKNLEIHIIWYKITHKSNNLGRKLQKIGLFAETGTNFHTLLLQIITCGCILAKLLKQLFFNTKLRWRCLTNQILQKYPQIIVENTENLPDSSSYTIEYKIVRNSHLLSQNWHFLKCHSNCSTNKRKLLTHNVTQAAIDCSYIYCEGNMAKCYKHALFSSNALLLSLVLESQLTFPHKIQNKEILRILLITTKTDHNGSFFLYKKQHFYRFIQLAATTRHEKTFNNDM